MAIWRWSVCFLEIVLGHHNCSESKKLLHECYSIVEYTCFRFRVVRLQLRGDDGGTQIYVAQPILHDIRLEKILKSQTTTKFTT